jgi:hypothetical protein
LNICYWTNTHSRWIRDQVAIIYDSQ